MSNQGLFPTRCRAEFAFFWKQTCWVLNSTKAPCLNRQWLQSTNKQANKHGASMSTSHHGKQKVNRGCLVPHTQLRMGHDGQSFIGLGPYESHFIWFFPKFHIIFSKKKCFPFYFLGFSFISGSTIITVIFLLRFL